MKRSTAIVPAAAILSVFAAIGFYNYSVTGSADHLGKAMAKSGTPSQRSGGLGKMDAENKRLHMGEDSAETTEPADRRPPTSRPVKR
ncbi:MAG: hypothetical protein CYPHOPRED_000423 [Cyphobasidiales sp. Tagirdzhanova-0007]|nr:MAG: hypothetical protein CYPHOPRED_000423 [Cyphobasidiales sp. Tagirdzhanova-0007]